MSQVEQKMDELQELPKVLRQMLEGVEPHLWKMPAFGGGFSLVEQICHLRDLEQEGYLARIQRILQEDCPELAEFDGAKVARERNYPAQDPVAALEMFEQSRSSSIAALSQLGPDQLQRKGRFGVFGMITIEQLIEMMLEHDRSHKKELETLSKEWQHRKERA